MLTAINPPVSLKNGLSIGTVSEQGELVFPSPVHLDRAWELGLFYLQIPDSLDLAGARRFASQLVASDNPYRSIPKYGELEGFIALENNQQTKLALSRSRWEHHYPPEIVNFGGQLDDIGAAIMRGVLRQSGIPECFWAKASGGYLAGSGTAFLNFVHYDTRKPDWGLRPHTDYGFVTILDATAPGLQIEVDGQFHDVPILPNHFVINFGEALHFVTAHSNRSVSAVKHRVLSQQAEDPIRYSTVYFANPDLDGMLLQFDSKGDIRGSSSVADFFKRLEKDLTQ